MIDRDWGAFPEMVAFGKNLRVKCAINCIEEVRLPEGIPQSAWDVTCKVVPSRSCGTRTLPRNPRPGRRPACRVRVLQ